MLGDHVSVLGTRAAMLDGTLERAEGLFPLTARATVPEVPGVMRSAGNRHRAPRCRADAMGERRSILEVLCRHVTGGARHLPVSAEPFVEEERFA